MKILFISNVPSPYRFSFLSELAKYSELTAFFEGRRSGTRSFDYNDKNLVSFKVEFFEEIFSSKRIKFYLIQKVLLGKYDKIIVGLYSTWTQSLLIIFLKLLGKKYYFESDGGIISKKENKFKFLIKKALISGAYGYFSTGEQCDNYLIYYGAKKQRLIRYKFTSLHKKDIVSFVPDEGDKVLAKRELKISYKKVILGVGQFIHRKGFDILLESAKYFSNEFGIYLVGGEPIDEYLEIQKKLRLSNVHYIKFLSKQELNKWYLAADLFVLPTREDIWGLVINEAMAKGLPIITTNRCLSGVELLKNKECLIPVEDSYNLGKLIDELMEDKSYLSKLSKTNLSTIREYTIEQMALDHFNAFLVDDSKN